MDQDETEAAELARQQVACLAVEDQEPPYIISGIAIGEGDVTRGQSGIKKKWPREALEPAAESLAGRPLVEDHDNSSRGVVGEVTHAEYQASVGVLYKAELYDEELAEKIENGLLEVSIRGYHGDVDEMAEDEQTGAKVVEKTVFDNLSIVPTGAAPSNTVEMGPSVDLSAAECAEMLDVDDTDSVEAAEGDVDVAELEATIHEVEYDGKTTSDWSEPALEDFTDESWGDLSDDQKAAIGDHFFASVSGFPADSFGDMKLPAVEPSGELNLNGLDSVYRMAAQTDGVSSDDAATIKGWAVDLAETFDGVDWSDRGAENQEAPLDDETGSSDEEAASNRGAGAGGEPESTATDTDSTSIMTDELKEQLSDISDEISELREETAKVDELEAKLDELAADDPEPAEGDEGDDVAEELKEQFEDDLAELKERTQILDEVSREHVEDLRDADDPMVVESEAHAELEASVETVRDIYAEALAAHVDVGKERILDKWSLDEMKEDLEAEVEDVEEELSPARTATDPDEEELEEAAEEQRESVEDELSEEVKAEQERLAEMIGN